MDWKQYEREITEQFRQHYPSARITSDVKLMGKFSRVERQIDLLIEEQAADFSFRIIVDAKYRGRKIDVGDVEAFIGFLRDVEAHSGVMIAPEGYTSAAISRAYHDDLDLILDVLNLEELKQFQGLCAIPYSGEHAVVIGAPFGCVIDATRRADTLAWIYPRGRSWEEALTSHEFMYVNFWSKKDKEVNTLDSPLKYQDAYIKESHPSASFEYLDGAAGQRAGARTLIRRMKNEDYPVPEYTGFVDFENFIFMCVLFSPESLERKNLRKLRFVLREAAPMNVTHSTGS